MPAPSAGNHRAPSWADYGTHGGSAKPGLWNGCILAFCPSLGPTGDKLIDLSRMGGNGTLSNIEQTDWEVNSGAYALHLDGTNERITVPSRVLYQPREVTVSAWILKNGPQYNRGIVGKYDSGSDARSWLLRTEEVSTDKIQFLAQSDGASYNANQVATSTNTAPNYEWVHVAGRVAAGGYAQVFINGRLEGTAAAVTTALSTNAINLEIGSYQQGGAGTFFDGLIDDIRVYNRALNDAEIRELASRRGIAYEPRTSRRRPLVLMGEQTGDDPSSQSSASSASSVSSLSSSSSSVSTSSSSASSISTSSQSGPPAIATGYQQVNVTAAVKTIDAFTIPWWASHAELQAMTQDVRYTLDGLTDPTQYSGFVLEARAKPEAFNMDDFIRIKFTRGAASDAQLNVHFIPRGEP